MLIERSGTQYRITGQHVIDYFPSMPAGSIGEITSKVDNNSNETQLTLADTANIGEFTAGDAVRMVDEDGNVASYTPQTSALSSVSTTNYSGTITATSYSFLYNQPFSYGSLSNVFNRAYLSTGGTTNGYGVTPSLSHNSSTQYRWHKYTFSSAITVQDSFMMDIYDGGFSAGSPSLGFIDTNGNETLTTLQQADVISTSALGDFSGNRYAIPNLPPGTQITAVKYQISPLGPKSTKRCIDRVYALIHDGMVLTDGIHKLNFASPNSELSLFQEGSIVNGINSTITASYNWSNGGRSGPTGTHNLTNSFDGNVNTWGMLSDSVTSSSSNKAIVGHWEVNEPVYVNARRSQLWVPPGADLEFKIKTSGQAGFIQVYDIAGNMLVEYDAQPARTATITYSQAAGYWLQRISGGRDAYTSGRQTIELAYVKVDGTMLVNGTNRGSAEVQMVDTTNNAMYVNIGDFSTPNTVSAEPVSGSGNYSSSSGSVITVTNSNLKWVTNSNRLSQDFYVKVASTVNGLAYARALAESTALPWSSSTGYLEGDFVTHNGYYWRALEYNVNVTPNAGNFEEWLGFGSI